MSSLRSHPLIPQFNLHLHSLKSKINNGHASSLSSIAKKLHDLENLYNYVDYLLLLPHTYRVFSQESHKKWVDEILDGYLDTVDVCATAIDFVSQSKECISSILSVLRRRSDSDNDIYACISSRKMTRKNIKKSLRNIRGLKNKLSVLSMGKDEDQETIANIRILKEAESITIELMEDLLLSVLGTKSHWLLRGWLFVPWLVLSRKVSAQDHKCATLEFEHLDSMLCKFVCWRMSKRETGLQVNGLQIQLRDMDVIIRVVEERLECLFKRLIQSRVSLLNMHSHL